VTLNIDYQPRSDSARRLIVGGHDGFSFRQIPGGYEKWELIRRETYENANYKCEICGAEQTLLECHERWQYDDGIKKLIGLMALCPLCHEMQHYSYNVSIGRKKELVLHFAVVNDMELDEAKKYLDEAYKAWLVEKWVTDFHIDWSWIVSKAEGLEVVR